MFQNLQAAFGNILLHGKYLITFLPKEALFITLHTRSG